MKLTVKNLGAISHAEVDLSKDLILFTGENNTGKTYLAYTIYGLYNLKNKLEYEIEWLDSNTDETQLVSLDLEISNTYIEYLIKQFQKQLLTIFATSKDNFKKNKISIDNFKKINERIFETNIDIDYLDGNFIKKQKQSFSLQHSPCKHVIEVAGAMIASYLFPKRARIFTSERSGVNVFSRELSLIKGRFLSGLLKNANNQSLIDLANDRINRYPQPIQMELALTERYDMMRKQKSSFNYLADELETTFLNGRVHASESGDLRFTMDNSKKELEIHATSSTVKSLSPLVFYLRHLAEKNDFIIIDEPELNLHPNNQRKIARFMGRLIQEGFKVLVSTHSDYIVRELNNLIMLHSGTQQKPEIAQDLLKTHGYAANELLDKGRVGVYLFRLGKPVESVLVDNAGFSVATIDEEASKLNQTSQDIYFNLFD